MHFDLAHALVSGLAIFATVYALKAAGIVTEEDRRKWNWKIFGAVFIVIFVINLIWPLN